MPATQPVTPSFFWVPVAASIVSYRAPEFKDRRKFGLRAIADVFALFEAAELLRNAADDPHVLLVRGLATIAQPQNGPGRTCVCNAVWRGLARTEHPLSLGRLFRRELLCRSGRADGRQKTRLFSTDYWV
jgi:hypothetical protein